MAELEETKRINTELMKIFQGQEQMMQQEQCLRQYSRVK